MADLDLRRWLIMQRRAVVEDLTVMLDVEAGLREALIPGRHAALVHDLHGTLDIEAGLAAIVPRGKTNEDDGQGLSSEVAEALASLQPRDRIALRHHPAIVALALLFDIDLTCIYALTHDCGRADDGASLLKRVRTVERDLWRICDLAPGRALDHVWTLSRALDHAFKHIYDEAFAVALVFAHDLAHDLVGVLLLHTFDLARKPSFDRAFAHDLDFARDIALVRALKSGSALDLDLVCALDMACTLDRARNDFTGADLREVDMVDVDLEGVRWSEATTRWPANRLEQVRRISVEIEPGLFEIRTGTPRTPTAALA